MKAWLTARRVKRGHEEEFRKKWRGGDLPEGMIDAYLLEDEEDPRETLSISLWDTADGLLSYRTSEESDKRHNDLKNIVDKHRWSRDFVAWNAWEMDAPGGKKKMVALPLLLLGVGAAAFYFLKMRGKSSDQDEWDSWEADSSEGGGQAATVVARPAGGTTTGTGGATATGSASVTATRGAGSGGSGSGGGSSRSGRSVRDLMTPSPETVDQKTDVVSIAQRMRTLDVGFIPVMADGRLAGVVTDRDIAIYFADSDQQPGSVCAGDVMTEAPHTIQADSSIQEASKMMAEHQIRRLPVVEGTRVVGVISLGDLAAEGQERAAATALHEISEPSSPDK